MARAKRTDRADARRRYRVTASADDHEPAQGEGPTASAAAGAPGASAVMRGGLAGMVSGIRLPDVRADVAAMPATLRSSPGLWFAFALGIVAIVAGLTFPLDDTGVAGFVLPLFIQAPGIPVLVGGFVAPRGAWLVGGGLGLMQALGLVGAIYRSTPSTLDVGGTAVALISGIVLGSLFAALAGWYRRWLKSMNTRNAAMRAERQKQQRRDAKRTTRPAR